MEPTALERQILQRYRDKCAIAGGPREGYVLRRRAIGLGAEASADGLDAALTALVEKGLLAASAGRDFYFLTAAGAEAIR